MALLYKKVYRHVQISDTSKWFARPVWLDTKGTADLAERIQNNCTVKKSDVLAVLDELVEVMKNELQNSRRVKLNGFGTFKLGITSKGTNSAEEFDATKHIENVHILFQPETSINKDKSRNKLFCSDCPIQEAPFYKNPRQAEGTDPGA